MNKFARFAALAFVVLLTMAVPAMAQSTGAGSFTHVSGALGAGLVTIGGAYGIGKLAASSVESMARQPEAGGRIFTSLIVAAALIEGFTFFALVICMQQNPFTQ